MKGGWCKAERWCRGARAVAQSSVDSQRRREAGELGFGQECAKCAAGWLGGTNRRMEIEGELCELGCSLVERRQAGSAAS